MSIRTQSELEATRAKLKLLEERCQQLEQRPLADGHVHELNLQSLRNLIKQLKEEIARFEVRATAKGASGNNLNNFVRFEDL